MKLIVQQAGVKMILICRISVLALLTLIIGTPLLQAHTVQVCKASDTANPVSGAFTFEIYIGDTSPTIRTITPGTCSDIITTISREVRVIERAVAETELVSITGIPPERLVSFDLTTRTANAVALEDSTVTQITFTNRSVTGNQGCTPGFYKNHTSEFTAPYTTGATVGSIFTGVLSTLALTTLLQALDGGGGPGIVGAQTILLRAATAALLNAAHPGVSYALTTSQILTQVNAALATNDRTTILALADRLDALNNGPGGCPL